ncbi:glycoside hydrolase family 16 protein [Chitinophaga cymbidii]|uniref:Glycosyl hydrolase family 16 n=1 Tax=Chitinophaga cymbidii TaxID=1096750 RepID=A0A512RTB0_9BACT|nr:family 16 glycosylhydrolase [Chitinophaga cymbidii]GEP98936.1 glycosyl hydrolase family 16 [Chitinophaga cymbidii]
MKNMHTATWLIILVSLSSCFKQEKEKKQPEAEVMMTTPPGATWVLDSAKSDEFDSLDTTKWSAAPLWYYGGVTGDFAYKEANTVVTGGLARIKAQEESYNGKAYTAGCLKSKFEIGGDTYLEVRAKSIWREANVCIAIWLGDQPTVAKNPNIEIDMQETKDADSLPHQLNTSLLRWPMPYDPAVPNKVYGSWFYPQPAGLDEDFHIYGLERRSGKLRFYMDNVLYFEWEATDCPEFVTQLRPLILSIEGHAGDPVPAHLPSDFLIDWVRVYNAL